MDPVSAAASVISIVDVSLRTTSALIKYIKATKDASSERKLLAEETLLLSKLLARLRERADDLDDRWLADHADLLKQFDATYHDLAITLNVSWMTTSPSQPQSTQPASEVEIFKDTADVECTQIDPSTGACTLLQCRRVRAATNFLCKVT